MKNKIFLLGAIALVAASCCNNVQKAETIQTNDMKTLVVVDVQRDFFSPEGSLYVSGGELLPAKIAEIAGSYDAVVFTLDWHPGNHCSFAAQGGPWPVHCVAYTQGAGLADEFSPILASGKSHLFFKGMEQDKEQYGAFENLASDDPIKAIFEASAQIDVCGIAGDYCVKSSAQNVLNYAPAEKVSILTDLTVSIDDGSTLAAFIEEAGL